MTITLTHISSSVKGETAEVSIFNSSINIIILRITIKVRIDRKQLKK
jgi:hypothetical protein